jgi:pimeloyl-ACP methyl ester carboxylesterase
VKCLINGRTAYAYTGGKTLDPTLPAVVMVHGALNDHSVWIQQSRYLAHHGMAVLAVDLPAHGRSEGPPMGVDAAADWVLALLEAAGIREAALVGHSMGSLVALEAAARLGPRARHLAMVATAYPMKVSPALLEMCRHDVLQAINLVTALSHATLAPKPSSPGPGFSTHGGARALMRRMQRGWTEGNLFEHDFLACDGYTGLDAAAARVSCPVTLMLGTADQMTNPKAVAPVVQALKPQVLRLPSGHNIMAEAPDALLQALCTALMARPAQA